MKFKKAHFKKRKLQKIILCEIFQIYSFKILRKNIQKLLKMIKIIKPKKKHFLQVLT